MHAISLLNNAKSATINHACTVKRPTPDQNSDPGQRFQELEMKSFVVKI